MTVEAWIVALLVVATLFALWRELASPSFMVFGGVVFLLAIGILTPAEAFSGFSNPAPITVAALFVVARAVSKTGALDPMTKYVFGSNHNIRRSMARIVSPTVATSGFVNNIPLVAMLMPQISQWTRRNGSDAAKFLMPLSFAAILGGMLTVIGTSTNLVVSGQMDGAGLEPLAFFEIALVGLPIAVGGILLIVFLAPSVLGKNRSSQTELVDDLQDYTVEMTVVAAGPAEGSTVEEAGLRQLEGVFLVSIDRGDETIAPATPTTLLHGGDVLRFVGRIEDVLDLQKMAGLNLAEHRHVTRLGHPSADYFTVVIGADSPLMGQTLKQFGFRERYQAAVVAIHRAGHRVEAKLGDVEIRLGDTLVLIADAGFKDRWQNRSDFLLVASMQDNLTPPAPGAGKTMAVVATMIVVAATGLIPILQAALVAAIFLIVIGVLTAEEARRAVDLEVIGLIASAFGLAAAVETSGLAEAIAVGMVDLTGGLGSRGVLFGIVLVTIALTELVTNNAAALLMFPLAVAAAPAAGIDARGMAVAVAIAASASFLTPIGYQTNTMVYGPGGYRFGDYARLGAPITILVLMVLVTLIPVLYPA
ncbi:MAG: SLC13 family permease [Acidimicrobiia bacterium]|nr:SLC13 family permease [Acidimicrobiia bacterium]